jgi:isopenicillin-N epimerase
VSNRDLFLLDPAVVYLNHGAFGACPRPVFDVYQEWQRELEREPVDLFERRLESELAGVRAALGDYVGAAVDDLALVLNATAGMNAVLRSLALARGDEILTTDHEYGAIELLLDYVATRTGAVVIRASGTEADAIWTGATGRTRVLVVSHVTSPTALLLPVEDLCRKARDAGVLSVVDGAHAPGQVPLDLGRLGADFYAGNCHKWLCAPKGAGFLYARPECQGLLQPLVAGWGYGESRFAIRHDWESTRDPAAYLAVPAAIEFVREHGRPGECRALLREGTGLLAESGFEALAPEQPLQMAAFRLPACDHEQVKRRLFDEFRIEVPVREWNGHTLVRVSVAPYTTKADLEHLAAALRTVFSGASDEAAADRALSG